MKKISLYCPNVTDYWYEAMILSDPLSMSYNAGYNVSYEGYNKENGCINFPKNKWLNKYNKRKHNGDYFAYIKDNDINEYIGYVNYQYNKNDKRYECGILIEAKYRGHGYAVPALKLLCEEAKKNKISELYDSFEMTRKNTLEVFLSAGFSIVSYQKWLKSTAMVDGVLVKITL